jgi:hypothetical protein
MTDRPGDALADLWVPELDPDYMEPDDGLTDFVAADFDLDPAAEGLLYPDEWSAPESPPDYATQDLDAGEGRGGLGGIPGFVRTRHEALAIAIGYVKNGRTVTPGYCLRETRGYYAVGPYYLAAKDSLAGAQRLGVAHRVEFSAEGVKRIPRGGIVYLLGPRSTYGHVGPSVGGGVMVSTDWPTGRYGLVGIYRLALAWGYTEIWWAPCVNDVRVWTKRKPKATPLIARYLADPTNEKLLRRLADEGDGSNPGEVKQAARKMLDAYELRGRAARIEERADRKLASGRQSLESLEVGK